VIRTGVDTAGGILGGISDYPMTSAAAAGVGAIAGGAALVPLAPFAAAAAGAGLVGGVTRGLGNLGGTFGDTYRSAMGGFKCPGCSELNYCDRASMSQGYECNITTEPVDIVEPGFRVVLCSKCRMAFGAMG